MALTKDQQGVFKGMATALVIIIGVFLLAGYFLRDEFSGAADLSARLAYVLKLETAVALWLAFSIGRLARHRFFNPEDIHGGGLTEGSAQARVMQATLQNTLEQTVLAVLIHLIWAVYMPTEWLAVLPAAVLMFILGRVLFTFGYAGGASARALGFALTFYSSLVMLVIILIKCLSELF